MAVNIIQVDTLKPVGFRYKESGYGVESRPSNNWQNLENPAVIGDAHPLSMYLSTRDGIILKPMLNLGIYPVASECGEEALEEYPMVYAEAYGGNEEGDSISKFHCDVSPLTKFLGGLKDSASVRVIHARNYVEPNLNGGPRINLRTDIATPFTENQGIFFAYANYRTSTYIAPSGGVIPGYDARESNILRNTDFIITVADREDWKKHRDKGHSAYQRRAEFWILLSVGKIRVVLYNSDGTKVFDKLLSVSPVPFNPMGEATNDSFSYLIGNRDKGDPAFLGQCSRMGIFPLYDNICIYIEPGSGVESTAPIIYLVPLSELNEDWFQWGDYPLSNRKVGHYPIIFKEDSTIFFEYRLFKGWFDLHRLRFARYALIETIELCPGYEPASQTTWLNPAGHDTSKVDWTTQYPSKLFSETNISFDSGYGRTVVIEGIDKGEDHTWWFRSMAQLNGVDCVGPLPHSEFEFYTPNSSRDYPTHTPILASFFVDFPMIAEPETPTQTEVRDEFKNVIITKTSNIRPGDANASKFEGNMIVPFERNEEAENVFFENNFLPNRQMKVVFKRKRDDGTYDSTHLGTYYLDEYRRSYNNFHDTVVSITGRCLLKYLEEHITMKNILLDGLDHKDSMLKIIGLAGLIAYYQTKDYFTPDGPEVYPRLPEDPRSSGDKLYEFQAFAPLIDLAKAIRSFSGWKLFARYINRLEYKKTFAKYPRVFFVTDSNWYLGDEKINANYLPLEERENLDCIDPLYIKNFSYSEQDIYKTRIFAIGRAIESRNKNKQEKYPLSGPIPYLDYEYSKGDWLKGIWVDKEREDQLGDSRLAVYKDLLLGDYQAIGTTLLNIARFMKGGYRTVNFEVDEDHAAFILYDLSNNLYDGTNPLVLDSSGIPISGEPERRPLDLFDPITIIERGFGAKWYFIRNLRWNINKFTVNLQIEAQIFDATNSLFSA